VEAGFAYASMVDPQTQADSGVLLVLSQLAGGLIFFSLGLDLAVVRIFARSLETLPPGSLVAAGPAVEAIVRRGGGGFRCPRENSRTVFRRAQAVRAGARQCG
jgi:flagellar biosynthesis protein FliR